MSLSVLEQRAWRLANLNGALWAFGNGLISTTLVNYIAKELGATAVQISWILALPHLAGVLRLGVPFLLSGSANLKAWTLFWFVASAALLCCLPCVAHPVIRQHKTLASWMLIFLWGGWHVSLYCALVPYFSWLGDLSHGENRAQRLGTREMYMTLATMLGTLCAAGFATLWIKYFQNQHLLEAYVLVTSWGALCILLSVLPIWEMPASSRKYELRFHGMDIMHVLFDRRYLPLLLFQTCFSFANGISGAAVNMYPYRMLGLNVAVVLYATTYMRGMQSLLAPWVSPWLSAKYSRYVLMTSQMIVSIGLLFYYIASKEQPLMFWGAWTCWIAYVALNIGLPHEMLRLAPREHAPAYIAINMALGGVVFGISTLLGGYLIERIPLWMHNPQFPILGAMLIVGFVLRFLTSFLLLLLPNYKPIEASNFQE